MASPVVEVVAQNICTTVGEGPHWEENTGKLLFVDILAGIIHRFHVNSKSHEKIKFDEDTSFIIPRQKGNYVISLGRKIALLDFENKSTKIIAEIEKLGENNRFNDAKCDGNGRLWAGSMGSEPEPRGGAEVARQQGCLGCLNKQGQWKVHVEKVDLSNGMAWTADGKTMFYIDSVPRNIYAYDYDVVQGTMSNQRVMFDFNAYPVSELGYPDGCCIDADDHLWVACFGGSRIIEIDTRTGTKLRHIMLPTQNITSCCWGGDNYEDLYVTSGVPAGIPADVLKLTQPTAGSVFKISGLGANGLPGNTYSG